MEPSINDNASSNTSKLRASRTGSLRQSVAGKHILRKESKTGSVTPSVQDSTSVLSKLEVKTESDASELPPTKKIPIADAPAFKNPINTPVQSVSKFNAIEKEEVKAPETVKKKPSKILADELPDEITDLVDKP